MVCILNLKDPSSFIIQYIISHYQANRFKWNRHLEYIHSLDNKEFSSMYSQKVVVNWQSVIEKITQLDNIYM